MHAVRALLPALLATTPITVGAHHSVALNFSPEVISIEGTITSVKWINPHASFILEVTSEDGTSEEWLVEMLARIALQRQGFDFDSLQEGSSITATGRVGYKDNQLFFLKGELADGRIVNGISEELQRLAAQEQD